MERRKQRSMRKHRSTANLIKQSVRRSAYAELMRTAVESATQTFEKVSSQLSNVKASTERIKEQINLAESITSGCRRRFRKYSLHQKATGVAFERNQRIEKRSYEEVTNLVSEWKARSKVPRVLDGMTRTNVFDSRIKSVLSCLDRREEALNSREHDVSRELDHACQHQCKMDDQLRELDRRKVTLETEIKDKEQAVGSAKERVDELKRKKDKAKKELDEGEEGMSAIQLDVGAAMDLTHRRRLLEEEMIGIDDEMGQCLKEIDAAHGELESLLSNFPPEYNEGDVVCRRRKVELKLDDVRKEIAKYKKELASMENCVANDETEKKIVKETEALVDAKRRSTELLVDTTRKVAELATQMATINRKMTSTDPDKNERMTNVQETELETKTEDTGNLIRGQIIPGKASPIRELLHKGASCNSSCHHGKRTEHSSINRNAAVNHKEGDKVNSVKMGKGRKGVSSAMRAGHRSSIWLSTPEDGSADKSLEGRLCDLTRSNVGYLPTANAMKRIRLWIQTL